MHALRNQTQLDSKDATTIRPRIFCLPAVQEINIKIYITIIVSVVSQKCETLSFFRDFHPSTNTRDSGDKSKGNEGSGEVGSMGEKRNACKVSVSKAEGNNSLEHLGIDVRVSLKWFFKKEGVKE